MIIREIIMFTLDSIVILFYIVIKNVYCYFIIKIIILNILLWVVTKLIIIHVWHLKSLDAFTKENIINK